jgi:hypothetical protein
MSSVPAPDCGPQQQRHSIECCDGPPREQKNPIEVYTWVTMAAAWATFLGEVTFRHTPSFYLLSYTSSCTT